MIDAKEAERLITALAEKSDKELLGLFLINGFACALSGGRNAPTVWAKLHKAIVEEMQRRHLKSTGGMN